MTEIKNLTNKDIYPTWKHNKTRFDASAFGPEYAIWQQTIPQDVRKIVLDFNTAKKLARYREQQVSQVDFQNDLIPPDEYSAYREKVIKASEDYAEKFLKRRFPYGSGTENLLAVALCGSSLYQPRRGGDVDIWFVFMQDLVYENYSMENFRFAMQKKMTEKYELTFDPSAVTLLGNTTERTPISWLVQPHTFITKYYLPDQLYQNALKSEIQSTRRNKQMIYNKARSFIKTQDK